MRNYVLNNFHLKWISFLNLNLFIHFRNSILKFPSTMHSRKRVQNKLPLESKGVKHQKPLLKWNRGRCKLFFPALRLPFQIRSIVKALGFFFVAPSRSQHVTNGARMRWENCHQSYKYWFGENISCEWKGKSKLKKFGKMFEMFGSRQWNGENQLEFTTSVAYETYYIPPPQRNCENGARCENQRLK